MEANTAFVNKLLNGMTFDPKTGETKPFQQLTTQQDIIRVKEKAAQK